MNKLIALLYFSLKLGFFSFLFITLISIFIPKVFTYLSDFSLKQVGVYESIQNFDKTVTLNFITEGAEDLKDKLLDLLTNDNQNVTQKDTTQNNQGPLEKNLYPSIVQLIALIYRIVTILMSFAGLFGIIYLSYSTSGATDLADLRRKVSVLENKVKMLEEK